MKRLVIVALFVVLLATAGFCKDKKKHHGEAGADNERENKLQKCQYKSVNGSIYDLHLMDIKSVSDHSYIVPSGISVYFRSCGFVKNPACQHSSVCVVSPEGKAVDFGSYKHLQFAEGSSDLGSSIEATYGNGEICSNGIPRKTLVQYTCGLDAAQTLITRVDYTDCYMQILVQSAHACSTSAFCGSLTSRSECENQEGFCSWASNNTCQARDSGCAITRFLGKHHGSFLAAFVLLAFFGVLLSISLCLFLCACRSKRIRAARAAQLAKQNDKSAKKAASSVPYQPALQLIPGGFAPVNPYAFQGYPMVQLVAPTEGDSV